MAPVSISALTAITPAQFFPYRCRGALRSTRITARETSETFRGRFVKPPLSFFVVLVGGTSQQPFPGCHIEHS